MKVRLTISRASVAQVYKAGDVIEVSDEEGLRLVAAGKAVAVAPAPETTRRKRVSEKRG